MRWALLEPPFAERETEAQALTCPGSCREREFEPCSVSKATQGEGWQGGCTFSLGLCSLLASVMS